MPERSRKQTTKQPKGTVSRPKKQRGPDANETAYAALQAVIEATEGTEKDPLAVMLGRRGGLKGGRARADNMTKEQRSESARQAAIARWKERSKDE